MLHDVYGKIRIAALQVPPDVHAVRTGRLFTASALRAWSLESLTDETVAIVSELLSNAVRHATRPAPVALGLLRAQTTVLTVVCDHSLARPVLRRPDPRTGRGRGLALVAELSSAWGCTLRYPDGKSVWAVTGGVTR